MINAFGTWEEADSSEDFFKDLDKTETPEASGASLLEQVAEENSIEVEEVKSEEPEEEEVEEEDLFANIGEDEELADTSLETKEDGEEEVKEVPSKTTLSFLKDKGLVSFELEEGEELTDELAEEILEDSYEEAIETRIEEKLQGLPQEVKALVSYSLKGGNLSDFLKETPTVSSTLEIDLDMSEEDNQVKALKQIMAADGDDEETIETQIELLKDSGRLEKFATAKYNKWVKDKQVEIDEAVQKQKDRAENMKKAIRESKAQIASYLAENKDIDGIQYSRADKKELASFISDRNVTLDNGSTISEMQKALFYEIPKNEVAMMQLAVLLRNRKKDGSFNFDAVLLNSKKTEITKDLKNKLRRKETNVPLTAGKNPRVKQERALADYFS